MSILKEILFLTYFSKKYVFKKKGLFYIIN